MSRLFRNSFIFGEASSSHFFMVTTLTKQLFFRSSYFFRSSCLLKEFLFQNSHFFTAVIFSEQLLFQSKTFTEQPLTGSSLGQLLFEIGIVYNKNIYIRATFSKQVLLHSISFFRRATFWKMIVFQKRNIPYCLLFLESYLLRAPTFSDELLYHNILFQ